MRHLLFILLLLLNGLPCLSARPSVDNSTLPITVFAGNDQRICPDGVLDLATLEAFIVGDVDDGMWFVMGDGHFLPGEVNKLRFSEATTYVPGPTDISTGGFSLMLVSDDPDDDGPMVEVTDIVTVFLQSAPLACNASLNISLDYECSLTITPHIILSNPQPPFDRYSITLWDDRGLLIPDNELTIDHIGKRVTAEVTHECSGYATCVTELYVTDKSPPPIECTTDSIPCSADLSPDSVGFPIPEEAILTLIGERTYQVTGLDACTDATLTYFDEFIDQECQNEFERILRRNWYAEDEFGNSRSCVQEIFIRRDSISGIELLMNLDNVDLPALECKDTFPLTSDGYPHPDFTGAPDISTCSTIQALYSDKKIATCGAGYKILREWQIIDWCTAEDLEFNQIIKVEDTTAPVITCPEDLTVENSPYICGAVNVELPPLTEIDDCSQTSIFYRVYNPIGQIIHQSDSPIVPNIPVGVNRVVYIVTDDCGNSESCEFELEVVDIENPIAVCDQFTVVTLGVDGTARLYATSIDDNSTDNCGIVKMEVEKMDSVCAMNQGRGAFVDFCCAEAGLQVMVSFIVTDQAGNENICMVEVTIQDKLPPLLTCPSDLTIDCSTTIHEDNIDQFGKVVIGKENREPILDGNGEEIGLDGWAEDNCVVTVTDTLIKDINCNRGFIYRVFTATDNAGMTASCTQTITITESDPFEYGDIMWPLDYVDELCIDTAIAPEISGEPTWGNDFCGQIASTYKDQFFPFATNSCAKLLRKWTVIDWCQYDRVNEEVGIWSQDQIIKFENTTAPIFASCQDTILCSYAENCGAYRLDYQIEVTDDCTLYEELESSWEIWIDSMSTKKINGEGLTVDAQLPLGRHLLKIVVEDRCGNETKCQKVIEVIDCKAPTPHCISSLTTVLMQNSSSIEIKASDYDFQSFDNCTPAAQLKFSFSSDVNDTTRLLTCQDLQDGVNGEVSLEMWVTDLAGNQEYCGLVLILQDNNDLCPNQSNSATIQGTITSYESKSMADVEVDLMGEQGTSLYHTSTGQSGDYALDQVSVATSGVLRPSYESDLKLGINTLDIVKIQRHILGKAVFDNPYKIIAADVNQSGRITGADLIVLRKIILGLTTELGPDQENWRFVDADYPITAGNALDLESGIAIQSVAPGETTYNFIGIKAGDVDHSWTNFRGGQNTRERSENYTFTADHVIEYGQYYIDIKSNTWIDGVDGFQLALDIPADLNVEIISDKLDINRDHYIYKDGQLLMSYSEGFDVNAEEILFSIMVKGKEFFGPPLRLSSGFLQSEIYVELSASTIQIENSFPGQQSESWHVDIIQNPFYDRARLQLNSTHEQDIHLAVYNTAGQLIWKKSISEVKGDVYVDIPGNAFMEDGYYFLTADSGTERKTLKLLKVR